MVSHGVLADSELGGNFLVRQSLRDHGDDLGLARRQGGNSLRRQNSMRLFLRESLQNPLGFLAVGPNLPEMNAGDAFAE